MFIVTFDSSAVNSAPAAVVSRESRPFGHGILRRPTGPTLADAAYEVGRSLALVAERFTAPPAGYSAVEVAAFRDGQVEAMAVLEAREADHLAELAEDHANAVAVCSIYR
jgi:hypothetical protein